ncbi:von Willebrand factor A domain-containing protein 7-like isoform X2 [Penaeus chinensis]|uniref:von Willebrand factor A domain-containing protein 7-like isoform X2 n=1 Tax=Penaeus chinensis TaxID=139456 RepID=UPI001FB61C7D|nr:von Willebrand factor A domain-containing protein 7-like isoform X2 [Penaeus chinensis]
MGRRGRNSGPLGLLLLALAAPSAAFLGRGTLLEREGDIFGIYCDEFDRGTRVWHHREITREAVRRVIVDHFRTVPPAKGGYNHRDGMTLEEAYAEYFGTESSPKPFLSAVASLVDAAAEADAGFLGSDPRYHFGSERFSESQQILTGRWPRIVKAIQAGDYSAAIYMLGLSLSAIQDFYSYSNWVELGNEEFNPDVGISGLALSDVADPQDGTCKDCSTDASGVGACPNNLLQDILDAGKLTSGYNDGDAVAGRRVEKPRGIAKCSHGGSRDKSRNTGARGGINKELPTACFSPHHQLHEKAAQQAIQATEYYLTLVRGAVGDDLFVRFLGLYPTPALVLVLDTTDSMDKELAALVHTASRLVQQHASATYPPAEYLFVPFNDPTYGPVTRSQRPDEIYQALTALRAMGGGDEAELSMSALRLALHHAPPHAHVFLFTDASVKDPELFDAVVGLAHTKSIKVTPVLTMPIDYGGISGRMLLPEIEEEENVMLSDAAANDIAEVMAEGEMEGNAVSQRRGFGSIRSKRAVRTARPRRQLRSFSKYAELAERTGSQVVESPGDRVEETAKIVEGAAKQAVLWKDIGVTSSQRIKVPIDSLIIGFEVSVTGRLSSAVLTSPSGSRFDLLARNNNAGRGYAVVAFTPYLARVRVDMTQRPNDVGEWTLQFNPSDESSVIISARTPMDIMPTFYTPDTSGNHPSLQRVADQPSRSSDTYLDVVITGVDTSNLRRVDRAYLKDSAGRELLNLDFPIKSPRRNTYLKFPSRNLQAGRFTVVVTGVDGSGRSFRRESGAQWDLVDSLLGFPLGREVWGSPGDSLRIPVVITNTNADNIAQSTYFVSAYDALGSTVSLDQKRVTLGRNESVVLTVTMVMASSALPYTTNTLIVTAISNRGDTSHTQAHLSVVPKAFLADSTPPTCQVLSKTPCTGYLTPETCNQRYWQTNVRFWDAGSGIFQVSTSPPSDIPIFVSGTHQLSMTYEALCCNPMVTISVYDTAANLGVCNVDNGSLEVEPLLNTGEIAGIVVGAVVLLLLLILLVVGIVIRRRRTRTEDVTLRRRGPHNSDE